MSTPNRLTPERLAEIQNLTTRVDSLAPEYVTELLAHLSAVTRERAKMLPVCEALGTYYVAQYHGLTDEANEALNEACSLAIGVVEYARPLEANADAP